MTTYFCCRSGEDPDDIANPWTRVKAASQSDAAKRFVLLHTDEIEYPYEHDIRVRDPVLVTTPPFDEIYHVRIEMKPHATAAYCRMIEIERHEIERFQN